MLNQRPTCGIAASPGSAVWNPVVPGATGDYNEGETVAERTLPDDMC